MRYEIFSNHNDALFPISIIGYSKDTDITRFGPGRKDLYIVHYVLSGHGCFNGQSVSEGQGFLITPGMQEHYYPSERDPWSVL